MPKLQKWIGKKQFQVTEAEDGSRSVKVSEMFDFKVEKREKTDAEKVEAELKALQNGRIEIDKEMKLFNFYFFNHWRGDNSRDAVRCQGIPLINSEDLYFSMEGQGYVEHPQGGE